MPAQSSLNVNQTHVAGASWLSSHGVKLKIHLEDPVNKLSGRTAVVNSSCCEWDWKADLEAVEFWVWFKVIKQSILSDYYEYKNQKWL